VAWLKGAAPIFVFWREVHDIVALDIANTLKPFKNTSSPAVGIRFAPPTGDQTVPDHVDHVFILSQAEFDAVALKYAINLFYYKYYEYTILPVLFQIAFDAV
jgi:hypothetical protein